MPLMMWGIGSEPVASTKTSAVSGSILKAWRTTTVPRSKGPTSPAVIATIESVGAVVGAGEVELAGGVGEGWADAGAGQGAADLRGGRAAGGGELFGAAVGAGAGLGRGDAPPRGSRGRRRACR